MGMDVTTEIDRLWDSGVRFSISAGADGFVATLGSYAHQATPRLESKSLPEVVAWLREHVAREWPR
jgi:hypothetical protein